MLWGVIRANFGFPFSFLDKSLYGNGTDGRCSGKFVAPENNSHVQQYGLGLRLKLRVGLRSGLGLGLVTL